MTDPADTVWLITGCSSGFGREIARCVLKAGARVAVTARRPETVADICAAYPETAVALALDITDAGQRERRAGRARGAKPAGSIEWKRRRQQCVDFLPF